MLVFRECDVEGYSHRTRENATADATLAFAIDFTTAGEKLTKKCAEEKLYFPIDINSNCIDHSTIILLQLAFNKMKVESLNIAGNGLYTLKQKYTQQEIDDYIFIFLQFLFLKLENKITLIQTGGQTGVDEAGGKAGVRLGIDTLIYAPKGWKFRDETGRDIFDEKLFKERFI